MINIQLLSFLTGRWYRSRWLLSSRSFRQIQATGTLNRFVIQIHFFRVSYIYLIHYLSYSEEIRRQALLFTSPKSNYWCSSWFLSPTGKILGYMTGLLSLDNKLTNKLPVTQTLPDSPSHSLKLQYCDSSKLVSLFYNCWIQIIHPFGSDGVVLVTGRPFLDVDHVSGYRVRVPSTSKAAECFWACQDLSTFLRPLVRLLGQYQVASSCWDYFTYQKEAGEELEPHDADPPWGCLAVNCFRGERSFHVVKRREVVTRESHPLFDLLDCYYCDVYRLTLMYLLMLKGRSWWT